jgi:hypothetical protein
LKRYYTGIPCLRGHLAARYVSTNQCVACQLEHGRRNGGWKARPSKETYLAKAQGIVVAKGGILLSDKYVSAKAKLSVRCSKGHDFRIAPDALASGGWCPGCKGERLSKHHATKFKSIEELRKFARQQHAGDCLATEPRSMHSKVFWKCKNVEHPSFAASISNVIHSGSWCPACDAERKRLNPPNSQVPQNVVQSLVEERGGKIVQISGDGGWNGLSTRLRVRCANGHDWDVSASQLVHAGSWCPECLYKGERIVRAIFEETFGQSFPKVRPDWLASSKGNKLELDGYSEQLKIAFEYQGPHHNSDASVQETDEIKRRTCARRGIQLIEVDAIKVPFPSANILSKVEEAFKRYERPEEPILPDRDLFSKELEVLRDLARERGGELLSTAYLGWTPHEWKCAIKEHPSWHARAEHIRNGHWCRACAISRMRDEFALRLRLWGRSIGLELLDEDHKGTQDAVYRWRCAKSGHVIERCKRNIAKSIASGRGPCPECYRTSNKR